MTDAVFQTNERYNNFIKTLNAHTKKDWVYQIWEHCPLALVDNDILNILNYLKEQHIKTVALTMGHAGPKAHFKVFEQIRHERLKKMGIEFNWSFKDELIVFNTIAKEHSNPPLFYKGILHSCGVTKSKVLEQFLHHSDYKPTKIIFIDDLMSNINDIGQWCSARGIDYQGFHYTAVDHLVTEFNEQRAQLQADQLIKYDLWLSDQEADKLLEHL